MRKPKLIGYQITDPKSDHIEGLMTFEVMPKGMLPKVLNRLADDVRHKITVLAIYEDTIEDYAWLNDCKLERDSMVNNINSHFHYNKGKRKES